MVPALRLAFIRHVGPYEQAAVQFDRLARWVVAHARRRRATEEPLFLGVAHDGPGLTPAPCSASTSASPSSARTGGRYAIAVHRGSFATLAETYY